MTDPDVSRLIEILPVYAKQGRPALISVLQKAQEIYGYVSQPAAAAISRALRVPLAEVYGVIEFYSLLYSQPVGKTLIHVCNDPACAVAGADGVFKRMTKTLEFHLDQDSPTREITVERAPCLGLCEHAPALLIQSPHHVIDGAYEDLVSGTSSRHRTKIGGTVSILTANCGKGHPASLEEYQQNGGYLAIQKALQVQPEAVIQEVKTSGLVGRGGAAFPTGIKWEGCARESEYPHYLVCNADEAEPGTFKDRVIMEDDPHRILEGILIAAYAIGAEKGYMYIRGEYVYPYQVMKTALDEARKAYLIGEHILGTDFSFELELRRGAGAYICGEETALFESIEGKRGFPRVKPPFPTRKGLFGKPTVINNVETLCNIPVIIQHGAAAYRQMGTEKSPGTKLFCLSGDINQPGLYEIPFGMTLREMIFQLAGGIRNQGTFQSALVGGAAGAFASANQLDAPLSFEGLRSFNLPLGSGVITVFDDSRSMPDILLRLAHFFKEESCGKCYPCQMGTQRQLEIMERMAENRLLPGDTERLSDLAATMTDASLCGLGQTASSAISSAMRLFPHLFKIMEG